MTYSSVAFHLVTATYSGDSNYQASSGSYNQPVKRIATTAVLTASPDPATVGQVVTYTAKVSPVPDGGLMSFLYLIDDSFTEINDCVSPTVAATERPRVRWSTAVRGRIRQLRTYVDSTSLTVYTGIYDYSDSPVITETVHAAPGSANGPAAVNAPVSCGGSQACTVTETLTTTVTMRNGVVVSASAARAPLVRRTVVVGTSTVTIGGGRTRTVSVSLNATGRSIVRRLGQVPIVLTVKSKQRGKRASIKRTRLTIIAPRHHKK